MKIKVNRNTYVLLSVILILFEAFYWGIDEYFIRYTFRIYIWVFAGVLSCLAIRKGIKKNALSLWWFLYFLLVVMNRNKELAAGSFFSTLRIVVCVLLIITASQQSEWIGKIPKYVTIAGIANVFATIIFYLNNGLYRTFIQKTYGAYQSGTSNGVYGYKAALAGHYSLNGTYIVIVLLSLVAFLMGGELKKRHRKYIIGLILVSFVALLLTTKRAHLLFGIAAIIITYYAVYPSKRIERSFKLMMVCTVALILLSVGSEFIPELSDVFSRFETAGEDHASIERFIMWDYALNQFWSHPILGIGWYGFSRGTSLGTVSSMAISAGCHNIYLQLLCECGIVGFSLFCVAAGATLYRTYKNINMGGLLVKQRTALIFSFIIQVFILLYGMTGNPIYDTVFYFYAIAIAVGVAFDVSIIRKKVKWW